MKNLISMNMNINFQWKTEQEENILYTLNQIPVLEGSNNNITI